MKKFIALFMATIMTTAQVMAAAVSVELDGEKVEFSAQQPIIQDGRTLIPLRGVFEKLGYSVEWKADTKTAVLSKGGGLVEVTAGEGTMLVDKDEVFTLDVPAQIINGSMMLPLRAIGEASGLEVNWDSATKTVSISTGEKEQSAAPVSAMPEEDLKKIKAAVKTQYDDFAINYILSCYKDELAYSVYQLMGIMAFSHSEDEFKKLFASAIEIDKKYKNIVQSLECGEECKVLKDKMLEILDDDLKYSDVVQKEIEKNGLEVLDSDEQAKMSSEQMKKATKMQESFLEEAQKIEDNYIDVLNDERYNDDPTDSKLTPEKKAEKEKYLNAILPAVNDSLKFIADSDEMSEDYAQYKKAADTIRAKVDSLEAPVFCTADREAILIACDCLEDASEAVKAGAVSQDAYEAESIKLAYSIIFADFSLYGVFVDDYKSILDGSDIEIDEDILDNIEKV